MSVAAAHADAFYSEVIDGQKVYVVRDESGIPAPATRTGERAMPFWSMRTRAQAVITNVDAYRGMSVVELSLEDWTSKWLPGLERDGLLVGINWSGRSATGYGLSPSDVIANIQARQGRSPREA